MTDHGDVDDDDNVDDKLWGRERESERELSKFSRWIQLCEVVSYPAVLIRSRQSVNNKLTTVTRFTTKLIAPYITPLGQVVGWHVICPFGGGLCRLKWSHKVVTFRVGVEVGVESKCSDSLTVYVPNTCQSYRFVISWIVEQHKCRADWFSAPRRLSTTTICFVPSPCNATRVTSRLHHRRQARARESDF